MLGIKLSTGLALSEQTYCEQWIELLCGRQYSPRGRTTDCGPATAGASILERNAALARILHSRLKRLYDRSHKDLLFVGEVAEHRCFVYAGGIGEISRTRTAGPDPYEHVASGFKNAVAALYGA
jgi:hypothetical protein